MRRVLLITVSCCILTACGGGGGSTIGGSGSNGGSSNPVGGGGTLNNGNGGNEGSSNPIVIGAGDAFPETDSPIQAEGIAVTATFSSVGGLSNLTAKQSSTLQASADTDGNGPDAVNFTTNGQTIQITSADEGGDLVLGGRAEDFGDDNGALLLPVDDQEFVVFGGWAAVTGDDVPAPGDTVSLGAFGGPTPVVSRPSSASYSGNSLGITDTGGDLRLTASDVSVTTDFSNVTFTSENTIVEPVGDDGNIQSASELDFTASGTVTNDGYTAAEGGMTVTGNFYGPNAEETGGVFTGSLSGGNYIGSFAAD